MTAKMKKINIAVSVVCVGLAIYALREAATFRHTIVGKDPTGPAFFPRIMAAALILLVAILLGQTFFRATVPEEGAEESGGKRFLSPIAGMAALFVYALVLEPLGFIVATALLALALLFMCGVRKWHVIALYPVVSSLTIYYVFRKLLVVFLPEGIFYF